MKRSRLEEEFPLDTPQGVAAFLMNYDYVRSAAYDKSDFDAVNMLVDFEIAFSKITMTKRQREAFKLVCIDHLTQKEAGEIMGISQQAVGQLTQAVIKKISEQYAKDLAETRGTK